MRKSDAVSDVTLARADATSGHIRDRASRELVCLALILAVGAVLWRIYSMW